MQISSCVTKSFGYLGCSNDVIRTLDYHCSGACVVEVVVVVVNVVVVDVVVVNVGVVDVVVVDVVVVELVKVDVVEVYSDG